MSIEEKIALHDEALEGAAGGKSDKSFCNYVVYTVASGDVLTAIAVRFGVTVQQICEWNNIANPDVIYVGQQLTVYPTIPY